MNTCCHRKVSTSNIQHFNWGWLSNESLDFFMKRLNGIGIGILSINLCRTILFSTNPATLILHNWHLSTPSIWVLLIWTYLISTGTRQLWKRSRLADVIIIAIIIVMIIFVIVVFIIVMIIFVIVVFIIVMIIFVIVVFIIVIITMEWLLLTTLCNMPP